MSGDLAINFYVLGDDPTHIYRAKLPYTDTVANLKEAIKTLKHFTFPSATLQIWKKVVPVDSNFEQNVADFNLLDEDCLLPLQELSKVFPTPPPGWHVHVLVNQPPVAVHPDAFALNCYVLGDDPNEIFQVNIAPTQTVSHLKEAIKARKSLTFQHVEAGALRIWNTSIPLDLKFEDEISTLSLVDELCLWPLKTLSTIFQTPPLPEHLHIVVKRHPIKHQLEEAHFDRLKRTKLATIAPSSMGSTNYEIIQQTTSERIFDGRPNPDINLPPISLMYDGFGLFSDIFRGDTAILDLDELETAKLQQGVDEFARKMCLFYRNEDDRRDATLPAINGIFSTYETIPPIRTYNIGSVRTDGHYIGSHGAVVFVTEIKNRITEITAMPEVEALSYVAHSQAMGKENLRELFDRWRIPSLCLTIVGSDIKFYAILTIGHQYRLVGLTPALSCIRCASNDNERKKLYSAFAAASFLQVRILNDIEKYLTILPPKIPESQYFLPSTSSLRKYNSTPGDRLLFQIKERHHRLLYIAETEKNKQIIVKFVRRYSEELHAFCSRMGHAPQILAFEMLPGGWLGVAMEYISSGVPITTSGQLSKFKDHWTGQLQDLVDAFHAEGLVHGDLRDSNIICDDEGELFLVDFDWGGKEGEAVYPNLDLNEELLEGRTRGDLKITKEDDIRVLNKTLGKFKSKFKGKSPMGREEAAGHST